MTDFVNALRRAATELREVNGAEPITRAELAGVLDELAASQQTFPFEPDYPPFTETTTDNDDDDDAEDADGVPALA